MSRSLRVVFAVAAASATILGLSACFGGPAGPQDPKPEITGFGTIDGETPEPIEPEATVEPTAEPEDGFVSVTDDYEVLTVQVPASWSDVDGAPFTTDDGQEWARVIASPDIQGYADSWDVAGVEFAGTPVAGGVGDETLQAFLESVGAVFDDGCETNAVAQRYDDGFYTGFFSTWIECGDGDTEAVAITAQDPDEGHVVFLRTQLVTDEDKDEVLSVIISTFQGSL